MEQIRQGDVLITRVDNIPTEATPVPLDSGQVVLAYGEVTGHKHRIAHFMDAGSLPARLFDTENMRFLEVVGDCALVHEEHAPANFGGDDSVLETTALKPGLYKVSKFGAGTQRQYTPEAIISVAD